MPRLDEERSQIGIDYADEDVAMTKCWFCKYPFSNLENTAKYNGHRVHKLCHHLITSHRVLKGGDSIAKNTQKGKDETLHHGNGESRECPSDKGDAVLYHLSTE
jgi:hypothetical protein